MSLMLPFVRRKTRTEKPVTDPDHRGEAVRLDPDSPQAAKRVAAARKILIACSVCPRVCGAARLEGEIGTCRVGTDLVVASTNLHFGEEPPISGTDGSGTIFLSGCSLRCSYCQNYPISQHGGGRIVGVTELADAMLALRDRGAHNINFVTPTHFAPQILEAIIVARGRGMGLPIVWNTSGYERVETLRLLEGIVDIYLADMRYGDDAVAWEYSKAKGYTAVNQKAIAEMHRQVGILQVDEQGVAQRGLLVRHLILPEGLSGSELIFDYLAREISPKTSVSLMSQYFPAYQVTEDPVLGRRLTQAEYDRAVAAFEASGLTEGYCQELGDGASS